MSEQGERHRRQSRTGQGNDLSAEQSSNYLVVPGLDDRFSVGGGHATSVLTGLSSVPGDR